MSNLDHIFTINDYWNIVLNNYEKDGLLPYGDKRRLEALNQHAKDRYKAEVLEVLDRIMEVCNDGRITQIDTIRASVEAERKNIDLL